MGPILDAQLRVWDAKNFGLVSPGTHRNKFVKKSLVYRIVYSSVGSAAHLHLLLEVQGLIPNHGKKKVWVSEHLYLVSFAARIQ